VKLSSLQSYQAIEGPHDTLHDIYRRIVDALFREEVKPTILQRLFAKRPNSMAQRRAEAQYLMTKLVSVSEVLLDAIDRLEQEIEVLTDQELAQMAKSLH